MYIKQIIIQGFKSYKEQTVIEPFSPGTNIIVGRNGSGKSNFFAAIRFVLSDAYTGMGREERQALLHEGSGSAVMTAYVEVIFDNSDMRFPTGKDTLVLRRTIGLKKDEFSLDKKNATKTDVMNLLEAAGFSRSNPYYIVPQGRVTAITNMKDSERLAMLKEVAGTQIYENRRSDSLKIMQETNNKREKIDESLGFIMERLNELEEEKNELREYQKHDKDRRCLEYAFFEREQNNIAERLAEIDDLRQNGTDTLEDSMDQLQLGENEVQQFSMNIKKATQEVESLKREHSQLEEDRRDLAKKRAKLALDVKALTDGQLDRERAQVEHRDQLKNVKAAIASSKESLAKLTPEFSKRQASEQEVQSKLDSTKASLERLRNKQGRNQNFKSKADRDKALQKQLEQSRLNQSSQKATFLDSKEELKRLEKAVKQLENEVNGCEQALGEWPAQRKALVDAQMAANDEEEKLSNERKVMWREEKNLKDRESDIRQDFDRAKKDMSKMMDRDTARGLETVRRLKAEKNIFGAHGTIADLMEVPMEYQTAVEQVAGNSLFHYVVENADVATELVNHLQQTSGGRLTFMPIAQLKKRNIKLPNAQDAVPMMDKIRFDRKFEPAFSQIFGKTIICENLAIAAQYSRSHGCDAITQEGDKTSDKGALTGGYIDRKKSRLRAMQMVGKFAKELDHTQAQLDDVRKRLDEYEQKCTGTVSDLSKAKQALQQFDDTRDTIPRQLRAKRQELQAHHRMLEEVTKQKTTTNQAMQKIDDDILSLETELQSDFKKSLSTAEERQLEQLEASIVELQEERDRLSERRRELGVQKSNIESDLEQNLLPRLDNLNTQDIGATATETLGDAKAAQKEVQRVTKLADDVETKLSDNEQEVEEAQARCQALQQDMASKERQLEELAQSIEKHQRRMNKSVAKRTALQERATECQKNIRDLGVLPEEAFTKYQNTDNKIIEKKLLKALEALKKFKHVNKKAVEQYQSFTTQRDTLQKRRKELDAALESIETLIDVLDQRKDEKIERTFKQVSKEFARIFERLVPAGRGSLKIQRKADKVQADDDEEGQRDPSSVENYSGVGISVSFNSKHDEQQRIQQLSGGQKSLCALALVFAIQQCDPAPFYLFDEIDANLDAQYRTAVAEMLADISKRQSQLQSQAREDGGAAVTAAADQGGMSGQFICTTFRPEMLLVADKCYGVTFHNKTSKIDAVPREEALNFVDGQAPK